MLNITLEQLYGGRELSREEARELLTVVSTEDCDPCQVSALLSAFNMRPLTVDEFAGFRAALLDLCIPVDTGGITTMDLCGTGGDGKNTFNISTLSSLVAAGAGVKVAKHGNRSVSSNCGSSNVLEHLGVRFTNDEDQLNRDLRNTGICFLHAPLFHPALKRLAPVRTALGVKTFLNMLGPIVNPARPAIQMAGVFSPAAAALYAGVLAREADRFAVIYDLSGYDEISLTGDVSIYDKNGRHILTPEDFGLATCDPAELFGGNDVESAAEIFMNILEGKGSDAQHRVVAANAGLAVSTYFDQDLHSGVAAARASLLDGEALQIFHRIIESS